VHPKKIAEKAQESALLAGKELPLLKTFEGQFYREAEQWFGRFLCSVGI
jgi:hypothetical protein